MKIRPLGDRVVVRPIEADAKTPGGLVIPDTAREKSLRGKVVAVGPGGRNKKGERVAIDLKPGDEILYDRYAGAKVTVEGQELLILREDEILGRV
jgi:chaperonin GroES